MAPHAVLLPLSRSTQTQPQPITQTLPLHAATSSECITAPVTNLEPLWGFGYYHTNSGNLEKSRNIYSVVVGN